MPRTTAKTPNIVDEVGAYLSKYVAFADAPDSGRADAHNDQELAVSLWAISTWTFSESFPRTPFVTPYLYVGSPVKQCGKSLLIETLEPIVLNPAKMIGMTSSVLFRLIESRRPALFIDEADTIWTGGDQSKEEMRGVLNGGYKEGGYIWRTVPGPDGPEPTQFSTFCPKLIAGIDNGKLPETIADRAIPVMLRRKRPDQDREIRYSFLAGPEAEAVAQKIEAWVRENADKIAAYLPKPIEGINPRSFEISIPLLQIAHVLGIEKRVREMILRMLAPKPDKESPEITTLRKIKEVFESRGEDRIFTDDLIAALGDGYSGKLIANHVRAFEVGSPIGMTIKNRRGRGYQRHQFADAWERYL